MIWPQEVLAGGVPLARAVVEAWAARRLSDGAVRVYVALSAHRVGETAEIGDRELAKLAHVSEKNVPRYVQELRDVAGEWFGVVRRQACRRSVYWVPLP